MNFKLVPTICPYCGSNLAEKDGKVADVKPWMEHPTYAITYQGNFLCGIINAKACSSSYGEAVSLIANGPIAAKECMI